MDELQIWQLVLYGVLVLLVVVVMLGLAFVLGERRIPGRAARQPYEAGMLPIHTAHIRVPVQFYLIAMLFVIFDLEAVFIFAWAIVVREAGWLGFWAMTIFMGILFVALAYEWRVGALDWGPRFDRIRARMDNSQRELTSGSDDGRGGTFGDNVRES
jgi:NADH-quinone oxidoreductase subunit A